MNEFFWSPFWSCDAKMMPSLGPSPDLDQIFNNKPMENDGIKIKLTPESFNHRKSVRDHFPWTWSIGFEKMTFFCDWTKFWIFWFPEHFPEQTDEKSICEKPFSMDLIDLHIKIDTIFDLKKCWIFGWIFVSSRNEYKKFSRCSFYVRGTEFSATGSPKFIHNDRYVGSVDFLMTHAIRRGTINETESDIKYSDECV